MQASNIRAEKEEKRLRLKTLDRGDLVRLKPLNTVTNLCTRLSSLDHWWKDEELSRRGIDSILEQGAEGCKFAVCFA